MSINSWSEDNLWAITKDFGIWGWWANRPDTIHKLENPKLCIFTDSLDNLNENLLAKVGQICYKVRMVEISHDFSKDSGVLEDLRVKSNNFGGGATSRFKSQ